MNDPVPVGRRELRTGIEAHPERGDVRSQVCAGGTNSLQARRLPNSGSGIVPPWQNGKPKFCPDLVA